MVKVTREQLYEQVWQRPMTKLALEYGVSGATLAKTCRKLNVPLPTQGHWQRLEHGKAGPQPELPAAPPGVAGFVEINPHQQRGEEFQNDPKVHEALRFEAIAENRVVVTERLVRPHPIVEATAQALVGAVVDGYGMVSCRHLGDDAGAASPIPFHVSPASKGRALRIADALIKALERRGHQIDLGKRVKAQSAEQVRAPAVLIDGERIPFSFEEKLDRSKHMPTAAELAEKAAKSWIRIPEWDHAPNGKLSLKLDIWLHWTDRSRKRWSDGRGRVLEDGLNEIIVATIEISAAMRKRRLDEAKAEAERQERHRLRLEEEKRARLEVARRKDLEERALAWRASDDLSRFVAEVERRLHAGQEPMSDEIATWLDWARAHVARLNPLSGGVEALMSEHEAAAQTAAEPRPAWMNPR